MKIAVDYGISNCSRPPEDSLQYFHLIVMEHFKEQACANLLRKYFTINLRSEAQSYSEGLLGFVFIHPIRACQLCVTISCCRCVCVYVYSFGGGKKINKQNSK